MKRIAILGAGLYNKEVYTKLIAGGYYTIALDANPNAPSAKFANEFINLDISDKEAILNYFQINPVHAIMPINDWGVKTAAYVTTKLGLKGISEHAALASTDKGVMRDIWQVSGLPNPSYFVFSTLEDLEVKIENIGFPCVVKPTDSGGSGRGISVLKSMNDVKWAYDFAIPFVKNNRLICEGFVDGIELTIESISFNGEVFILAISDKEKPDLKTRVATSLNFPAKLTDEQRDLVVKTVKKAVISLGIQNGMAHTEAIIKDMKIVMVETAARGGGGHIFHTIIEAVSGISAPILLADILTGFDKVPEIQFQKGAVYRFFNPPYGILKNVVGIENAKLHPALLDIGIIKKAGELVGDLKNSLERAGYIVVEAEDRNKAVYYADEIEKSVVFEVEKVCE